MLRCINFLEQPSAGQIFVTGEEIQTKPSPNGLLLPANQKQIQRIRSKLGMVFQDFNLWEHKTILENVIEGPLIVQKRTKSEVLELGEQLLNQVGMWEHKDAYPAFLSEAKSSALLLREHWRWNLRSCCLMNRLLLLIQN